MLRITMTFYVPQWAVTIQVKDRNPRPRPAAPRREKSPPPAMPGAGFAMLKGRGLG